MMSENSENSENKALVRRLVEAINRNDLEAVDELFSPELAKVARRSFTDFRSAFPDWHQEITDLIAEGDKVVALFACSGTHRGTWRGVAPTNARFERVPEVYRFTFSEGRIVDMWGLEDTAGRLRQIGVSVPR
jgi:predicted ester cyclase